MRIRMTAKNKHDSGNFIFLQCVREGSSSGDEAAEELFEEVGGYGGAVAGGGADVVDGEGFGGEGGAGEAEGGGEMLGGEARVLQGRFGGVQADGAVG